MTPDCEQDSCLAQLPDNKKGTNSSRQTILAFATGALIASVIGAIGRSDLNWGIIQSKKDVETSIKGRELSLGDRHPNMVWSCDDGGYSKRTLKLAYEAPFTSLFDTYERTYEASSVIVNGDVVCIDGTRSALPSPALTNDILWYALQAYAVMDNSWSLYRFNVDLERRNEQNERYGDPEREAGNESGYEALFHYGETYYIVRESVLHDELQSYHAIIEEIDLHRHRDVSEQFTINRKCRTEFQFEGDSKGFEGVWAIHDIEGEFYLLALCEGNRCREKEHTSRGNGRIVVMKLNETDTSCVWNTVKILEVPHDAYFADYSAMAIREDGYVAITSQEDSMLWIGRLFGKNPETGHWNVSELAFDQVGEMFSFPKNENCETIYCNIEGIHWLDDGTLIAVSDKTHGEGDEDFRCYSKDQSVHVFALP